MESEIKRLLSDYPLPPGWSQPETFDDTFRLGDFKLLLSGLATRDDAGHEATGSAAELASPWLRSYFEMLERVSILEALSKPDTERPIQIGRDEYRRLPTADLFPESPEPNDWRYAKSNGVAAHLSWDQACRSALMEAIERDRILRSWYGGSAPLRSAIPPRLIHSALAAHFHFEAYQFPRGEWDNDSAVVIGIFGFPKEKGIPRVMGFGAHTSRGAAFRKAMGECHQNTGFLWGEPLPEKEPDFSPTPAYHQERYLTPLGVRQLRKWLNGGHTRFGTPPEANLNAATTYVDLTPPSLEGKLFVVKAICPQRLPLTFGHSRLHAPARFPEELLIHPMA